MLRCSSTCFINELIEVIPVMPNGNDVRFQIWNCKIPRYRLVPEFWKFENSDRVSRVDRGYRTKVLHIFTSWQIEIPPRNISRSTLFADKFVLDTSGSHYQRHSLKRSNIKISMDLNPQQMIGDGINFANWRNLFHSNLGITVEIAKFCEDQRS